MGRAIVRDADAFLFDEPLSNLDAKLRGQMRTEILRMQRRLGTEQYAYIPYDTSGELEETLDELERDLDSERMRSQLVVALDPASEVDTGSPATLGFDPKVMHVFDVDSGENLTQSAEAPLNAPA
jgi:multiple sugar transport system ATP-binding protein